MVSLSDVRRNIEETVREIIPEARLLSAFQAERTMTLLYRVERVECDMFVYFGVEGFFDTDLNFIEKERAERTIAPEEIPDIAVVVVVESRILSPEERYELRERLQSEIKRRLEAAFAGSTVSIGPWVPEKVVAVEEEEVPLENPLERTVDEYLDPDERERMSETVAGLAFINRSVDRAPDVVGRFPSILNITEKPEPEFEWLYRWLTALINRGKFVTVGPLRVFTYTDVENLADDIKIDMVRLWNAVMKHRGKSYSEFIEALKKELSDIEYIQDYLKTLTPEDLGEFLSFVRSMYPAGTEADLSVYRIDTIRYVAYSLEDKLIRAAIEKGLIREGEGLVKLRNVLGRKVNETKGPERELYERTYDFIDGLIHLLEILKMELTPERLTELVKDYKSYFDKMLNTYELELPPEIQMALTKAVGDYLEYKRALKREEEERREEEVLEEEVKSLEGAFNSLANRVSTVEITRWESRAHVRDELKTFITVLKDFIDKSRDTVSPEMIQEMERLRDRGEELLSEMERLEKAFVDSLYSKLGEAVFVPESYIREQLSSLFTEAWSVEAFVENVSDSIAREVFEKFSEAFREAYRESDFRAAYITNVLMYLEDVKKLLGESLRKEV